MYTFFIGKDGEKVAEGEEKMEVDEAETGSDQPVAPANIDDSTTEEALPDDKEPAEQMVLDDSAPAEETSGDIGHAEETSSGDTAPVGEASSGDIVPAEENSPDDMAPAGEPTSGDIVPADETSPDDNVPEEETSPDENAPIDETSLGDRTSPVEAEENCQASEAGDNRPSSQSSVAADGRLSSLEAEVRIPSPVEGSEIKCSQPPDDTEESVVSPSCNENESSEILRDCSELSQESEQADSREIRSSVSETEAVYTDDRAVISPVNNEVPPLSGDKLADTFVESTDTSLTGNVVPLLEEKAEPLSEQNKGDI